MSLIYIKKIASLPKKLNTLSFRSTIRSEKQLHEFKLKSIFKKKNDNLETV